MENIKDLMSMAEAGDGVAQYKMGRLYESGDGVDKDTSIAIEWYKRSVASGYKNAEMKLKILGANDAEAIEHMPETTASVIYKAPPTPERNINNSQPISKAQTSSMKSMTTAALLSFFFGIFGVHDFYLGGPGQAKL